MGKVNLDALIPREDFEVKDVPDNTGGRNIPAISINELKEGSFFFSYIRKPDFQRETSEWDAEKICGLIDSFVAGDLIPAIILWKNSGTYTFVIDGAHRLSALAAWVNDDYGDGKISRNFFGSTPEEQIAIAGKTRTLVNKTVGSYADFQLATTRPDKVRVDIVTRARNLGVLAVQLQWVYGDAQKAENSFFKINQEASPIDDTEFSLLKARKQPNGLYARAIIRSGKGHKYWSKFETAKQSMIESLAQSVNDVLFAPPYKTPLKTLDLPIAGKKNSSRASALILDFVNMVNKVGKDTQLPPDQDGEKTIEFLKNCKRVAERINSNQPSSLGLHPAVYFYSRQGQHKTASLYAITALMFEFENKKAVDQFISVRKDFEHFLIDNDYIVQQIVRRYRGAPLAYPHIKNFYIKIIEKLSSGKNSGVIIDELIQEPDYGYITTQPEKSEGIPGKAFSNETKSQVFMKEALSTALVCKICGGYIHRNSISVDHIERKSEGGTDSPDNGQLSHPYCNTGFKH